MVGTGMPLLHCLRSLAFPECEITFPKLRWIPADVVGEFSGGKGDGTRGDQISLLYVLRQLRPEFGIGGKKFLPDLRGNVAMKDFTAVRIRSKKMRNGLLILGDC